MPRDADNADNSNVPAGVRSSAAQKFALREAILVVATVIKELKFTAPPGYIPVPMRNGIVQTPKDGMPMTIASRIK